MDWTTFQWRITEDSIFERDVTSLNYFFGFDKCNYSMKGDTLLLKFQRRKRGDYNKRTGPMFIRKYLVLKSNKKKLELIHLGEKSIN